jgi:hypothetical protein
MFSGGSYKEVGRWLLNFLTSHAKRENARVEVLLDADGKREGRSYGARLRLDDRVSPLIELEYREVAENRGALAWCAELARRTRRMAAALSALPDTAGVGR